MTGAVIDLGAVARARNELAALVAAHPRLTSPEAQERLSDAIPDLMEFPMSNRLDPNATGSSLTVGVRLSAELLAAVDAEAARLGAAAAYRAVGRSDAVRSMLLRCIAAEVSTPAATATARPSRSKPSPEAACPTCDAGVWHPCSRCRARTRTCACTLAREDLCASCALAPVASTSVVVDLIVTPRRPDAPMVRARLKALQETDDSSHWTSRAVAERAGVGKNTVSKIMRGEPVLPKGLARVAAVLTPGAVAERAILTAARPPTE